MIVVDHSKEGPMKNPFSAILLPLPGFAFTRAERKVGQFILVFVLILVHLTGYSQPAERRDTLKDGAVVFRPMSDTYTKVTLPRVGGPSSREDYIRLMNETPCDKHTQSQYNRDVALVGQTVEARNRIRDTILSVLPVEKLEGIPRILWRWFYPPPPDRSNGLPFTRPEQCCSSGRQKIIRNLTGS